MFRRLFIRKHVFEVIKYIRAIYQEPVTSKPKIIESTKEDTGIRYCMEPELSDPKKERKDNAIATPKKDSFDAATVAVAMSAYLNEKTPKAPLSAATNLTFVQMLQEHMRKKKLLETQIYKAALMDRRLFSKIMGDINYKPSKDTVIALIFSLKLSLSEAQDLLERAGYTLSHSIKRDIIIEYFIKEHIYNLNNINAFLHNMYERIIGRNI